MLHCHSECSACAGAARATQRIVSVRKQQLSIILKELRNFLGWFCLNVICIYVCASHNSIIMQHCLKSSVVKGHHGLSENRFHFSLLMLVLGLLLTSTRKCTGCLTQTSTLLLSPRIILLSILCPRSDLGSQNSTPLVPPVDFSTGSLAEIL